MTCITSSIHVQYDAADLKSWPTADSSSDNSCSSACCLKKAHIIGTTIPLVRGGIPRRGPVPFPQMEIKAATREKARRRRHGRRMRNEIQSGISSSFVWIPGTYGGLLEGGE